MKKQVLFLLGLFLISLVSAQSHNSAFVSYPEKRVVDQIISSSTENPLYLLLASEPGMTEEKLSLLQARLDSLHLHLQEGKKTFKSDKKYLQWLVKEVRSKYLYSYDLYPTFEQLFISRTYNCLSGSALYGLILQQLNYKVEIHETAFHAYLIVKTPKQTFLIDATDAENGFVAYAYQIQARETLYRENERARHQPAFNRVITFTELAGLHYYNKAIVQFNGQNYTESVALLHKAAQLYPRSERIQYMQLTALQHAEKFESSAVAKKARSRVTVQEANTNGLTQK